MNTADRTALLLRSNGFTFDNNGGINYPKNGDYYFHQNLLLTLYTNKALDRSGSKYILRQEQPLQPAYTELLAA